MQQDLLVADNRSVPERDLTGVPDATTRVQEEPCEPLFSPVDLESYRKRWREVQSEFVDEPRSAVEKADRLVTEVTQKLTQGFTTERQKLETAWESKKDSSTEDLRVALRRYRSFFDRLLSM